MFSTCVELAGFAAITIATYLIGGVAAGLYVAGGCLLLVGSAIEDEQAVLAVRRMLTPVRWLRARISVERAEEQPRSLKAA